MSETKLSLLMRPMCAGDLDSRLFNSRSRPAGAQWFERQMQDEVYIAVAELDGEPVARIGLDFTLHANQHAAHIWSAHVDGDYQGRGIGTAIMLHLEDIARQRGFTRMHLEVNKDNLRAQKLYERLDYIIDSESIGRWSYPDGDRIVEVVDDNWTMSKPLADKTESS